MDAGLVREFIVLEWGMWEWLYIDGELFWQNRAIGTSTRKFVELMETTFTSYSYAALNEIVGANDPDHDGCFHMVDDPPSSFKDIDPRINEALEYFAFTVETGPVEIVTYD